MPVFAKRSLMAIAVVAIGVAVAGMGLYVGETDDAPGAGVGGILLLLGSLVLAVKTARRRS